MKGERKKENTSTPAWFSAVRKGLRKWYGSAARDLPWRRTEDGYAIWISEVMLQQTTVAMALPYYERFMSRFPTVAALAEASEHEVLRHWEGLGYYRRGRMLHAAARKIMSEHGGEFPRTFAHVRALPGVGRYTAGAVCSFAYDEPAPILEANTVRVWARLLAYRGSITSAAGQRLFWEAAERVLPKEGARHINQALMELGALVCTPRAPKCGECPVQSLCAARRAGLENELPRPKERPVIEDVREAALVIRRGEKVLIRQRAADERWAGLWDFGRFPLAAESKPAVGRALAKAAENLGLRIAAPKHVATLKHGVTRFRITLAVYLADFRGGRLLRGSAPARWVKLDELADYPLSVTGRKIVGLLQASEPRRVNGKAAASHRA